MPRVSARTLLSIAAEYVRAEDAATMAAAHGVEPVADLDEIAQRFDAALVEHMRTITGR